MQVQSLYLFNLNNKNNQIDENKKNKTIINYTYNTSFQSKEDVFLKSTKNNIDSISGLKQPFKKVQQLITSAKKFVGKILTGDKENNLNYKIKKAKANLSHFLSFNGNDDRKEIQKAVLFNDKGKVRSVFEYDTKIGKRLRTYNYLDDGKNVSSIHEFDTKTGNLKRVSTYSRETQTLFIVDEYNPKNGTILQSLYYQEDGKTLSRLDEFVPDEEILNKSIFYKKDGITVEKIEYYDPKTGDLAYTQGFNN